AGESPAKLRERSPRGGGLGGPPGKGGAKPAPANPRAADRPADKTQPPPAASEAPSADSHVPTEVTASAATTTAWTGFRCVGDRENCEEQDRGCGQCL